jgi:hypothetical protein
MHFTLGQHLALISEALPGFTYANGVNWTVTINFPSEEYSH